jgi:predicted permease
VTPGYFDALHVPLIRGRYINATDVFGGANAVVINDVVAQKYFGAQDPVGRRITFNRVADSASIWRTVVGVVGSERQSDLALPPRPEVFAPVLQTADCCLTLVVRTSGPAAAIAPAVRQMVAQIDPGLAFADVRTMDDVRGESAARTRFLAILLLAFAGVGVTLAVVGVYGVMAHVARGRTREMGIRIALGAQLRDVSALVVRRGLLLTGIGVGVGLALAFVGTRALKAVLYQVEPVDPLTFAVVPLLMAAAAVAACWLPAARAAKSDPVQALRAE